jgi:hypothetical protein
MVWLSMTSTAPFGLQARLTMASPRVSVGMAEYFKQQQIHGEKQQAAIFSPIRVSSRSHNRNLNRKSPYDHCIGGSNIYYFIIHTDSKKAMPPTINTSKAFTESINGS